MCARHVLLQIGLFDNVKKVTIREGFVIPSMRAMCHFIHAQCQIDTCSF